MHRFRTLRALVLAAVFAGGILVPFLDGLLFHGRAPTAAEAVALQDADRPASHAASCSLAVPAMPAIGSAAPEAPSGVLQCRPAEAPDRLLGIPRTAQLDRGAPPRAPPVVLL